MREREQPPSRKASAARDLAGMGVDIGMDIVGECIPDGFIGFVLYLAITVPIVLIRTFLDW